MLNNDVHTEIYELKKNDLNNEMFNRGILAGIWQGLSFVMPGTIYRPRFVCSRSYTYIRILVAHLI